MNKLVEIAKFLSLKWINEELLPYLLYIVEEIENEEDFLKLVPRNLEKIINTYWEVDLKVIVEILIPLCHSDDDDIRKEAV